MKPRLRAVSNDLEAIRVCGIVSQRHDEHELRCIRAWRQRTHPGWSQYASGFRISERKKLRRVK